MLQQVVSSEGCQGRKVSRQQDLMKANFRADSQAEGSAINLATFGGD